MSLRRQSTRIRKQAVADARWRPEAVPDSFKPGPTKAELREQVAEAVASYEGRSRDALRSDGRRRDEPRLHIRLVVRTLRCSPLRWLAALVLGVQLVEHRRGRDLAMVERVRRCARAGAWRCGRCARDCFSEGFVGEARRIVRDGAEFAEAPRGCAGCHRGSKLSSK